MDRQVAPATSGGVQIHDQGIAQLARRIGSRELSPVDLVTALLERIDSCDPALHAFLTVTPESALSQARQADAQIAVGGYRGGLHGIPYAVKDLIDTRGVRTTCGSTILAERIPADNATVIDRLEQAGAILLGKLVMTEFAGIGYHPRVTPPRNPWNADHWTGQSSSGSGVACAAGLCPAALGSDTGGSLRYPASACGVVGLRPTYGLVSRAGTFPLSQSLDAIGPMARSVEDVAILLSAIAGVDARDATTLDAAPVDYGSMLEDGCQGARIGVVESLIDTAQDRAVRDAVSVAAAHFESLRATLLPVRLDLLDAAVGAWGTIFTAECLLAHQEFFPARAADYSEALRRFLEEGAGVRGIDYARAVSVRASVGREIDTALQAVDVLLMPTMGRLPPTLAEFPPDGIIPAQAAGGLLRYTAPFALSGHPALSLPCGFSTSGLPIGLQLVARRQGEATLLRIARAYESSTTWHLRRPPTSAGVPQ